MAGKGKARDRLIYVPTLSTYSPWTQYFPHLASWEHQFHSIMVDKGVMCDVLTKSTRPSDRRFDQDPR